MLGIVLLAGPSAHGDGFHIGLPEIVAILGALTAAWSVILVRQLVVDHSISTIFLAQCVWIFLPCALLTAHELPGLTGVEWALSIFAATMATLGQLMMNDGYRCLTVASGASLQMLWPVMTALGGLTLFDERFAPLQIVGAVLILFGTWRVSARR
ncbi:MAG: EamA family transporter [Verrucomicrobiales bacterium]